VPPIIIGILFYLAMAFVITRTYCFSTSTEPPDAVPEPEWETVALGTLGWPFFGALAWFPFPETGNVWKYRGTILLAWLLLGVPATVYVTGFSIFWSICVLAGTTVVLLVGDVIAMPAALDIPGY
jgi:hypothetical protein